MPRGVPNHPRQRRNRLRRTLAEKRRNGVKRASPIDDLVFFPYVDVLIDGKIRRCNLATTSYYIPED